MGSLFSRKGLRFVFVVACFLLCVLDQQPQTTANGLSTIDAALKWVAFKSTNTINTHKADSSDEKNLNLAAPSPAMNFDPNQSNKRGVKKGSDPIHNRS
ncbi:hypothetical protein Csa_014085 [Cucumis sativus]|uniref:Uncharacterized protein n=1 Tax=Cucumis sativus TaxID=3659 RepID=A0A0A0LPD5_CUCSA|nr:hypothetical protein Csa_014085 [Cucumis sativus]